MSERACARGARVMCVCVCVCCRGKSGEILDVCEYSCAGPVDKQPKICGFQLCWMYCPTLPTLPSYTVLRVLRVPTEYREHLQSIEGTQSIDGTH